MVEKPNFQSKETNESPGKQIVGPVSQYTEDVLNLSLRTLNEQYSTSIRMHFIEAGIQTKNGYRARVFNLVDLRGTEDELLELLDLSEDIHQNNMRSRRNSIPGIIPNAPGKQLWRRITGKR